MEQTERRAVTQTAVLNSQTNTGISGEDHAHTKLTPQVSRGTCTSCGSPTGLAVNGSVPAYVYALGRIEPRFPRVSAEKELAQAAGREKANGLTDRQAVHALLSKRENRYLVRQLCWVMTIEGLETYILQPRD